MRILVLAGGSDQIALIKELQKRGHEVILLDYLDNPPAKKYVSKHIQESTLDIEAVKENAIKEKVDMVVTACTDQALLTVAKVSQDLCLPCYISSKTALSVTNKLFMKKMMCECEIPTSNYHILNKSTDLRIINDLAYPLIVKPVDCNSSKGVIKIKSYSDLTEPLNNAIQLSRSSNAIVEEYKDGTEISADFYVSKGNPILLAATSSTKIKGKRGFTISGSIYPVLTPEENEKITIIAEQIVRGFGLYETPLLIQFILSDGNFYVIEFSARMGGGSKYRLIQEISGVDIMSKYVDLILGHNPDINLQVSNQLIRMLYIYSSPGIFSGITGLENLAKEGIITEWFIYKTEGSHIDKAETSSDRVLGLLVVADSEEKMRYKISKINDNISILNEENQDIMLHDLLMNYE